MTRNTLLFMALLLSASCKKSEPAGPVPVIPSPSVEGRWEWTTTYRTYPPLTPQTPENTGTTEIITFRNNQYLKFRNGNLVDSARFTLGHGTYTAPYPGGNTYIYDSICYFKNGVKSDWDIYKLSSDSMTLTISGSLIGSVGADTWIYKRN